jgi:predicted glycoside hydrolase/deacetylase ChbG (UPF0249 family)
MNTLIINADDFGLTQAVTKGIFESIYNGVVSRTSAMMCTQASSLIKEYSSDLKGKIGLHLQLTDGKPKLPPAQIPSLVDSEGKFPKKSKELGRIKMHEVELEWDAQMESLLDFGITPSHIDTHHNVHRFPIAFKTLCLLAKKYKIPVRSLSPNMSRKLQSLQLLQSSVCLEAWPGKEVTSSSLIEYLLVAFNENTKSNKTLELMCHPGYVDYDLKTKSYYLEAREQELKVFLDPELPNLLKINNINLIRL